MPEEATASNVAVLNREVSFGIILYRVSISSAWLDCALFISEICSCKNHTQSKKKSYKGEGCPCKNANLKCCENCKCGTKKGVCTNKGVVVVVNRNPSAFARYQEEQANAEREIK